MVALYALGLQTYLLSVLFVALSDPAATMPTPAARDDPGRAGRGATDRARHRRGAGPWPGAVLAAFIVTLLGGSALTFGLPRFAAALLVNVWFRVTLGWAAGSGGQTHPWP